MALVLARLFDEAGKAAVWDHGPDGKKVLDPPQEVTSGLQDRRWPCDGSANGFHVPLKEQAREEVETRLVAA